MVHANFDGLGPRQRQILSNSGISGAAFDGLSKHRRAAFFDITFALALRAQLGVAMLRLQGGALGIRDDRLFFDYSAEFVAAVRDNTDQGTHAFKRDTFARHHGITDAVRQTTAVMSIQIGWAEGETIEVDIDVGNPQHPGGIVMHSLELLNNHGLGKLGRLLHLPGVRDHTDHTVLMKLLHAQPV